MDVYTFQDQHLSFEPVPPFRVPNLDTFPEADNSFVPPSLQSPSRKMGEHRHNSRQTITENIDSASPVPFPRISLFSPDDYGDYYAQESGAYTPTGHLLGIRESESSSLSTSTHTLLRWASIPSSEYLLVHVEVYPKNMLDRKICVKLDIFRIRKGRKDHRFILNLSKRQLRDFSLLYLYEKETIKVTIIQNITIRKILCFQV